MMKNPAIATPDKIPKVSPRINPSLDFP